MSHFSKELLDSINKEETIPNNQVHREDHDVFVEDNPDKALRKLLVISSLNYNERLSYTQHLS